MEPLSPIGYTGTAGYARGERQNGKTGIPAHAFRKLRRALRASMQPTLPLEWGSIQTF